MDKDGVLGTWKDVEELQRRCPAPGQGDQGRWIFRGQADFEWSLEPSLLRLFRQLDLKDPEDANQVKRAVQAEQEGLRAFQMAHPSTADQREWIWWWCVAQHYGGATRVLDWSGRLPVAVYFAATRHLDTDGTVFALDTDGIQRCGCLDNLGRSDEGWVCQQKILKEGTPRVIHWCRAETPHIRLKVQDGWFTTCTNVLSDQEEVIKEQYPKAMRKYTIPSASKPGLMREALIRGYSGPALFYDSSERSGFAQREQVIRQATEADHGQTV